MENGKKRMPPWWVFAFITVGGLISSGIYVGIMSAEGLDPSNLAKAIGFGLLGLMMFWRTLAQT